jgi:hypothetical protein
MRMFSRAVFRRAQSWRALLGITAACVAVSLASANGAPALAAGVAAGAPSSARPAIIAQQAAAYYSTGGQLRSVATVSANNAWAVGSTNVGSSTEPLMLHWNGKSWSRVTSPGVLRSAGQLSAITVVSAKDAWAVGSTGNASSGATHSLLLHWNGAAWSQVTRPAPVAGALSGVTATASSGWAVGYVPNGHNFPNSLALRLSGATWSRVSITGGIELVGVAVTGTSAAWALGYNEQGSELERWNGSKWTFEPSILPDDLYLMPAIAAGPGGTAFTVGVKESLSSASQVPVVLRLTGSSWHSVTVHAPSNGQLDAVTFAPGGVAWTAGSTGKSTLVLRWTGSAWARVASPNPGGSNEITGLGFAAAGNGWAVGTSDGKTLILHWNGRAWS